MTTVGCTLVFSRVQATSGLSLKTKSGNFVGNIVTQKDL